MQIIAASQHPQRYRGAGHTIRKLNLKKVAARWRKHLYTGCRKIATACLAARLSAQRLTFGGSWGSARESVRKYYDSVFGLIAFFPIVFCKVRDYVAMHNEKTREQT